MYQISVVLIVCLAIGSGLSEYVRGPNHHRFDAEKPTYSPRHHHHTWRPPVKEWPSIIKTPRLPTTTEDTWRPPVREWSLIFNTPKVPRTPEPQTTTTTTSTSTIRPIIEDNDNNAIDSDNEIEGSSNNVVDNKNNSKRTYDEGAENEGDINNVISDEDEHTNEDVEITKKDEETTNKNEEKPDVEETTNSEEKDDTTCDDDDEDCLEPGESVDICPLSSRPPASDSLCCGMDATNSPRIFNGTNTQIDQYPWLLYFEYQAIYSDEVQALCGGFLISGRYALSAAHCFVGAILQNHHAPLWAVLGDYNITNKGQKDCVRTDGGGSICNDGEVRTLIEKIKVHPEYNFTGYKIANDIAIVKLHDNQKFTQFIRPICLPTSDIAIAAASSPGLRFFVAGWGATRLYVQRNNGFYYEPQYSEIKLHTNVPFVDRQTCTLNNTRWSFISEKHICAGGEAGIDSCSGDSGGPLMYKNNKGIYEVVGVISTGSSSSGLARCGEPGRPAIYTNVYQHISWIYNNIEA